MRNVTLIRIRPNTTQRVDKYFLDDVKRHRRLFQWADRGITRRAIFTSFHASTKNGTMFRGYRNP